MTWIWRHLVSCLQCRLFTLGLAIQSIIILVIISQINLVTPPSLKQRLFWTALWKEQSHKIWLPSKSHNSHHYSILSLSRLKCSVDFTSAAEEKGMIVRRRGLLLYGEMRAHSGRPAPRPATSIEISVGECSQDKVVPIESSRGRSLWEI